jgi:glycosyltransferase involved in cell wall biosynthesis
VCGLRQAGHEEIGPVLSDLGVHSFIARYRPRGRTLRHIKDAYRDEKIVNRHGPFDVQHSMDFTSSPFEAIMARKGSRTYIFNQRGMNEDSSSMALKVKSYLSEKVIGISEAVMELLKEHGIAKSKLRKVYLGIDLNEIEYRAPVQNTGTKNILSVGHIVGRKGHQHALKAIALLKRKMPDVRLRIAGSPDDPVYFEQLKEMVKELDLNDNVEFLGLREDAIDLMRQSDVLLLCSEREAFGWVILEAHAVGLPVVASSVEGPKEVIEDGKNGLLVKVGDSQGFADALHRVLNSLDFARELAENGQKVTKEKFTAEHMVGEFVDIYREVTE